MVRRRYSADRRRTLALVTFAALALLAGAGVACSEDGSRAIVEPLASVTAQPTVPGGEKLGSTQATRAAAAATPTVQPQPTPTVAAPEPTPEPPLPSPTLPPPPPEPTAAPVAVPPSEGRWIEVDVTNYVVRLIDGQAVVSEIGPVGVGAQIDTGEYLSTQTGLFYVNSKVPDLVYDAPYDTYISHWVGFDADKDNGFHSLLKDGQGNVVDASTGRVSNGCIRVGAIEELYAFAEIGMPVWVHW